jgi:ribosomal protein S18 acetylase RimI-like enzyme
MITKIFNNKRITIRELKPSDIRNVSKFQDFINSLVKEDAMILRNKRVSLKEETEWLKNKIKAIRKNKAVSLMDETNRIIIGTAEVVLRRIGRQSHVADFIISIRKGYRGIGLGKYLMVEIIKLAKKKLKPKPKIISLGVMPSNKPAIKLYRKFGFKKVALVPRQFQYKGKLHDEIIMLLYL